MFRRFMLVVFLVVLATVFAARFQTSLSTQHLLYTLVLVGCGMAAFAASAIGRRNPRVSPDWYRYAFLAALAVTVASLDGVVGALGDRRLGSLLGSLIGVPAVAVWLRRALDLKRASLEDQLDAALMACCFVYLFWWYQVTPTSSGLGQVVALAYIAASSSFAALILFSARDLRIDRPRALTAFGLACQPVALGLAPGFIESGRFANNLMGSTVMLAGIVLLVWGMVTATRTPTAPTVAPARNFDAWWWGPLALSIALFLTHTGIGRTPRGSLMFVNGLVLFAGSVLTARVVLTVKGLQQASSRLRQERESFRRQALTDPLTGLANRSSLTAYLATELSTATPSNPVAVLFCDMDRLKVVNDSLGHDVGDQLITAVARRWTSVLRPDCLLSRVGGDEFVVVNRLGRDELVALTDRMHQALSDPFVLAGQRLTSYTSIGIAVATDDSVTPAEILRDADAAMYGAKAAGGATTKFFDTTVRATALERLDIERHLREMIDGQNVALAVQPIVNLRSGAVSGIESLLRWHHPTVGPLDVPSMISVAEETGLIVPLGDLIMNRSLDILRGLHDSGHHIPSISVNTSVLQLRDPRFVDKVRRSLQDRGLPPSALKIEVTESVLLTTAGAAAESVRALIDLGVSISMDDFGTGYSSLSYLGRMNVHELKLDGTFMDDLDSPLGQSVLEGVIGIAHAIGVVVVAERVETAAQLAQLRRLGCDAGQGFIFSQAVPPARLAEWLSARDPETRLMPAVRPSAMT